MPGSLCSEAAKLSRSVCTRQEHQCLPRAWVGKAPKPFLPSVPVRADFHLAPGLPASCRGELSPSDG